MIAGEMILRNRTISLLGVTTVIASPRTTKRAKLTKNVGPAAVASTER